MAYMCLRTNTSDMKDNGKREKNMVIIYKIRILISDSPENMV
jgi:hypothetical protein